MQYIHRLVMAALQLDMVTDKKQDLRGNFIYEVHVFPSILDTIRTVVSEICVKKKNNRERERDCTEGETQTKTLMKSLSITRF